MAAASLSFAMNNATSNGWDSIFTRDKQRTSDSEATSPPPADLSSKKAEPDNKDSRPGHDALQTISWPISDSSKPNGVKRRKVESTVQPGSGRGLDRHEENTVATKDTNGTVLRSVLPPGNITPSRNQPEGTTTTCTHNEATSKAASRSPPKRMLRLNSTGGLGSPGKGNEHAGSEPRSRKRGRPRKEPPSCLVRLKYPRTHQEEFSQRVSRILSGQERFEMPSSSPVPPTKPTQGATPAKGPTKAAHPFFTGKLNRKTRADPLQKQDQPNLPSEHEMRRKTTAATPGKIRRQMMEMRAGMKAPEDVRRAPEAPQLHRQWVWPPHGMVHIRGAIDVAGQVAEIDIRSRRKQKSAIIDRIDPGQQIPQQTSKLCMMDDHSRLRADGFLEPDRILRLPSRELMSGPEIRDRVQRQLSENMTRHPAVLKLMVSLPDYLTAYDHGRGESLAWIHKYAPLGASEVLQSGNEAVYLRDWMRTMAVAGVSRTPAATLKVPDFKPRKKRRKVIEELDDFIVSSDDENGHLTTLSDLEETASQSSQAGNGARSMVRSITVGPKNEQVPRSNMIVLSGPHGCGKTAMVHAAAKELNFQVFEINAGSRRSGKDVLERIGDVLGNHIVDSGQVDPGSLSAEEDNARATVELQRDLDSGRQGTMAAFFKSKINAKPKASKLRKAPVPKAEHTANTKPHASSQKQSVILLEEVDVLFEEDRSFWPTILGLALTSKRPIIMTCTDEFLLPLQDDQIQAILRIPPPPLELATDYLLLIAAHEGHLLSREAVLSTYGHRQDLRASITQLQFWCQMGIGDPRGGLSWLFQRWPLGTGTDAAGNAHRVTSQGSYHPAMGLLPSERSQTCNENEEELMMEALVECHIDPLIDLHQDLAHRRLPADTGASALDLLKQSARMADILSAFDVACHLPSVKPGSSHSPFAPLGSVLDQVRPDPTQPEVSTKRRQDFTEVPALLQDTEQEDPHLLTERIVITACSTIRHAYGLLPSEGTVNHLHQRIADRGLPESYLPLPSTALYAALEPLAEPPASSSQPPPSGNYTSLIAPVASLSTDIAPYIRTIATYDAQLEGERKRLHEAIHGGNEGKMRKTRAARGALEGKGRGGVRREKWWDVELDLMALARTGPACARPQPSDRAQVIDDPMDVVSAAGGDG